jgi:hypothetical protein
MQRREFNRATFEVGSGMDTRGRATADKINRGLRTGKERSFWRIVRSIFLSCLTLAGLLVAVAPLPARADEDKDSHHEREDNDRGIRAEITALQATVSALQGQVTTLQTANADLQKEITTLQTQLTAVQSNHALLLGPFVSVDPNPEIGVIGPNIIFSGANIHIVSGSGVTNEDSNPRGLGNLIIGYDEAPSFLLPIPGDRGGSHNLIIGSGHRFLSNVFGGLLAGENNSLFNAATSIVGGSFNSVGEQWGSILGGQFNHIGEAASGSNATIVGGQNNIVYGDFATVLGGSGNVAGGFASSVLGGQGNNIFGGPNTNFSIAPKPPFP